MKPTKEDVSRQFGKNARSYALSAGHAKGSDLQIVLQMLKPNPGMTVLDVATGAGHTAALIAPELGHVTAVDLAPEMIAETLKLFASRQIANATAVVMDVEALAFADEIFDAVTCRIAPHHFLDIEKAIREIARVTKRGGCFVLEDSYSPQAKRLDDFINGVERLRDPTHIRSYTKIEWRRMLRQAGLKVIRVRNYRKSHNIAEWMDHAGLDDEGKKQVLATFANAPDWARKRYEIVCEDGIPVSYTDDKLILRALKD